jgi:hypothetical protein
MFRELGSRRRSFGVVPLFGVAQRGVRVCDRAGSLGQLMIK